MIDSVVIDSAGIDSGRLGFVASDSAVIGSVVVDSGRLGSVASDSAEPGFVVAAFVVVDSVRSRRNPALCPDRIL